MAKRRKSDNEGIEEVVESVESRVARNDSGGSWIENNAKLVALIIGALFLLAAIFIVYKFMIQQPKELEAKASIYKAEQMFAQDSFALALENPGVEAEGFLDIIDNYSGTKTANLAKLYAGISYLNLGRYDDAISYLESHSGTGNYSPILKNGNLGDAYSEKGDFGKAISHYQKATSSGEDALLTPYYLYKLGLLNKRQGDNSAALSAFQKIKEKYPSSNEGETIDVMIRSVS